MKKLYTLGVTLSMVLFGTYSYAQIKTLDQEPVQKIITNDTQVHTNKKVIVPSKDDDPNVYFYEDFSNGLGGMNDNGAWTIGELEGELWIQVYPGDPSDGGYAYNQPIGDGTHPLYGTKLSFPNTEPVLSSPTADNGMMMIDMSRYNEGLNQDVALTATASLTSPTIDLTGAPNDMLLTFYQRLRLCCDNSSAVAVRLSVDDGATWIPYNAFTPYGNVNDIIEIEVSINISDVLEATADLSQVKIQFYWEGPQKFYYWYIDDVAFRKVPDNDLVAHRTFYNDYIEYRKDYDVLPVVPNELSMNYFNGYEYIQNPIYLSRSLNFAMEVENAGLETQTDVRLKVVGTSVTTNATHEWLSETGIQIAPGAMDTVRISGVQLSDIEDVQEGQYSFTFEVVQAEVEEKPEDNVGRTRTTNITSNILRNDEGTISTLRYSGLASDVVWGNRYAFPEAESQEGNIYITHIETMFLHAEDWAETQIGEVVYFNVRLGDVFGPENNIFFGDPSEGWTYENPELEFEIGPEHIFEYGDEDPVWVTFQLPSPILVEPNTVYQAEYRVPFSQQDIVFPLISSGINMEPYGAVVGIPPSGDDPAAWSVLGNSQTDRWNGIILRFRTNKSEVGLETATTEDGITLVQNYPNPFTDKTKIQFNVKETTKAKLEVRDIAGKLVYSEDFGTVPAYAVKIVELNRGNLAPGVYTYSVVTPDSRVTRKLTIQ